MHLFPDERRASSSQQRAHDLSGSKKALEDLMYPAVHCLCALRHQHVVIWRNCTGVLAARAASTVTGRASEDTGIRIESIIKAGLTGPMAEALAMYYQVRGLPQQTSTRLMLLPI